MSGENVKRSDVAEIDVLRAVAAFHRALGRGDFKHPTPDEALADRYPVKLILARMRQLDREGLIDYGVSLRTGFLTDKGLCPTSHRLAARKHGQARGSFLLSMCFQRRRIGHCDP